MRRSSFRLGSLGSVLAAALAATVASGVGCVDNPDGDLLSPDADEPEAATELFHDFKDGKYDSAGHPLNAQVTEAETACGSVGRASATAVALRQTCRAKLVGPARSGALMASTRLRVRSYQAGSEVDPVVATVRVLNEAGVAIGETKLTAKRMRSINRWQDVSVEMTNTLDQLSIEIVPAAGAELVVDYIELFPQTFRVAIGPGAGVYADTDRVTVEIAKTSTIRRIEIDGVDATAKWNALRTAGTIKQRITDFRTAFDVAVGDLAPNRGDALQLRVFSSDSSVATTELRKQVWPCKFEGTAGKKILVTGFQPFPADGSHENVSGVAVQNVRISELRNVMLMRVILPVEYDRAAGVVQELIARCKPDAVVSFGQGGGSIELEQTAYNLKDASNFPDNRGLVLEGAPIDAAAPAERATSLPLDKIEAALQAAGEAPQRSTDPGRYICNNVFFAESGAITARGFGQAGFIHLPYTSTFRAADRARFGKVVEQVVNAIAAS